MRRLGSLEDSVERLSRLVIAGGAGGDTSPRSSHSSSSATSPQPVALVADNKPGILLSSGRDCWYVNGNLWKSLYREARAFGVVV